MFYDRAAWLERCNRDLADGTITRETHLARLSSEQRLPVLVEWFFIRHEITAQELHGLLQDWWSMTDAIHPNTREALWLFQAAHAACGIVAESPVPSWGDEIAVYRGVAHAEAYRRDGRRKAARWYGISWSLSPERAMWFATNDRFHHGEPYLLSATIATRDILGWFNERAEQEVILSPALLRGPIEIKRCSQ